MKWLGPNAINPLAIDGTKNKTEIVKEIRQWVSAHGRAIVRPVIIVSYETLRSLTEELGNAPIGLLLCDEAHRLKNSQNQTYVALNSINVQRRVLLTGTPIQNDLTEYFALLDFAVPGYLGTRVEFKKNFENTIMHGRNADASELQIEKCQAKLKELNTLVNKFVIRRTNDLLTKYCKSYVCISKHVLRTLLMTSISACQVRACSLLFAFSLPACTIPPFRIFSRNQGTCQRQRVKPSSSHWYATKALQPSGLGESRERPSGQSEALS